MLSAHELGLTRTITNLHSPDDVKIRVMNVQLFPGLFAAAGGPRSDRSLLEALVSQGHEALLFVGCFFHEIQNEEVTIESVEIINPPTEKPKEVRLFRLKLNQLRVVAFCIDDLGDEGFHPRQFPSEWLLGKVENKMLEFYTQLVQLEIRRFKPTHFLCSDYIALNAATEFMPCEQSTFKVIVIVHVTNMLPFGPQDINPLISANWTDEFNSHYTKVLETQVTGVWVMSKAVQEYIFRYGSTQIPVKLFPLHPSRFDAANAPTYSNFDEPGARVLAINPGSIKGFSIFYPLAREMPDTEFIAVKSWDVTEYHASLLSKLANVELISQMPTLEPVWKRAKILLVPSIWLETFGNVVVEAMLRGIPVICSNAGGLPEAKCGIEHGIIPVTLATNEREDDEEEIKRHGPLKIPDNSIQPWIDEITNLLGNRTLYESISIRARQAAHTMVNIDDGDYVKFLQSF